MATVDPPMVRRAATSVALRPTRSPMWPKTAYPSGRARKAMPKVASEASVAVAGSDAGKNNPGKTSTAAVPWI